MQLYAVPYFMHASLKASGIDYSALPDILYGQTQREKMSFKDITTINETTSFIKEVVYGTHTVPLYSIEEMMPLFKTSSIGNEYTLITEGDMIILVINENGLSIFTQDRNVVTNMTKDILKLYSSHIGFDKTKELGIFNSYLKKSRIMKQAE